MHVDVDTLLQRGFFVWDCGMLGRARVKKSHIFVHRMLGLYNILDWYSRYERTCTYIQKIDPS
jgi:hypothetical protein